MVGTQTSGGFFQIHAMRSQRNLIVTSSFGCAEQVEEKGNVMADICEI
jgi:hypothetical protein